MSFTLNFRLYVVNHVCETNEFHTVHKLQVYYSLPAEYTLCCYSTGYCLTNFHATAGSPSFTLLFDCLRMPQSLRNLLNPKKVVFLFLQAISFNLFVTSIELQLYYANMLQFCTLWTQRFRSSPLAYPDNNEQHTGLPPLSPKFKSQ